MRQVVKTAEQFPYLAAAMVSVFTEEEREFLLEMVEPEMVEGKETLAHHQTEALIDVDDIEAFTNNVGRQKRRMEFLEKLYKALEGRGSD